jgi:hypothetical protein
MRTATAKRKPSKAIERRKVAPIKRQSRELAIKAAPTVAEAIEKVLIVGDLNPLTTEQRLEYYKAVCKSLGLNPLTRPFDYIAFKESDDGPTRLQLYARRDCTDQLRKIHGISVTKVTRSTDAGMFIAEATVCNKEGKTDCAIGVVPVMKWDRNSKAWKQMTNRDLANAQMKAETKAKRRATLSICGLGFLDETELDNMQGSYNAITASGREIVENPEPANPHLDKYLEREKEALKKLSEPQKEVVAAKTDAVPALFYTYFPESETYQISGSESLKTGNRDLLAPLWSPTAGAIVATPEQIGKLISQFEDRKVPFKELQRAQ